jgi:hypothetical protein
MNFHLSLSFRPLFLISLPLAVCFVLPYAPAQTQGGSDASSSGANQSWTATTRQQLPSSLNPSRTSESHTEAGGRTVDNQSIETMGMYGRYAPYLDLQKETVKVDANTVRTIERAYGRDSDGRKTLVQVNEEEKRTLTGGVTKTVRTTSNPDANGSLQVVQREIQDTRQINPNVQETKSTFFTASGNGGLAASMQTTERDTKTREHNVDFRKSTLLPDLNGGWQVGEVREGTVKEDGKDRTKDERVLRPGADGNLTVVERTVSKETENAAGEKKSAVETYSNNLPGSPVEDNLRLNQRVITVSRKGEDGKQSTETQVEQRNPGQPSDRPRLTEQTIDIVQPGLDGTTRQTQTLRSLNSSGGLGVVSVDTRKQDNSPAIKIDIAPAKAGQASTTH